MPPVDETTRKASLLLKSHLLFTVALPNDDVAGLPTVIYRRQGGARYGLIG
jgi:hypothetical protein